jgi:putative PIN family toxin of toxin-antitoxin system
MRVVIDTNVFVSGLLLPTGVPGLIVAAFRRGDIHMVTSEPMLDELGAVLAYPKLQKRIRWDSDTIARYLTLLRFEAEVVSIDGETVNVPRDARDSMVLRTLLAGSADYLISGDADLLSLAPPYAIVSPTDFAKRIF